MWGSITIVELGASEELILIPFDTQNRQRLKLGGQGRGLC